MNKFMLLTAVFAALSVAACGKKEAPRMPAQTPAAEQPAVAAPVAQVNGMEDFIPDSGNYGTVTSCPVMGEKIVVGKDTKAVKYKGKVYFLCCPSCLGQFKAVPEKYAK